MDQSIAFAPGHISGFFAPFFSQQGFEHSGSLGAGVSVSLGATSQVNIAQSTMLQIEVKINGKPSPALVTKRSIQYLLGGSPLHIRIKTKLDLPMGQGFGMSGAGALSAVLATAKLLNLSSSDAVAAAHNAEVELRTGLGDVIGSAFGGFEIRRSAGLPPWGVIEHIPGENQILLAVVGNKIKTSYILNDKEKLSRISSIGRLCTKQLLEHPSVDHFFELSQEFSIKTTLLHPRVREVLEQVSKQGIGSMAMLGNAVFCIGNIDQLCTILGKYSKKIYICDVDSQGARMLQ